jgi:two-component system sensor histidine kinase/response regulator
VLKRWVSGSPPAVAPAVPVAPPPAALVAPAPVAPPPAPVAPPPAIPELSFAGIDTAVGLAYAADDPGLFRKVLMSFRDNQRGFVEQFATARQAGDAATAFRLAHTLKGLSANIGAADLAAVAEALELACRNNADETVIAPLQARVGDILAPLLADLARLAPEAAAAGGTSSHDLLADLGQLRSLLENQDFEAADLAQRLADSFAGHVPQEVSRKLLTQIRVFNYPGALATLDAVAESLMGSAAASQQESVSP